MNDFRRFLSFFRPYRWQLAVAGFLVVLVGGFGLVLPWALQHLVDTALGRRDATLLDRLALGLLGLIVLQSLFHAGQTYLLSYVGERVVADLRVGLYRKLQQLDVHFFSQTRVGEIISRITNDVTTVQSLVAQQLTNFFTHVLIFFGAVVLVIYINPRLACLMLLVLPPAVLAARLFGAMHRGASTMIQDRLATATAVLEETLAGVRLVKSFVREEHETRRFSAAIANTLTAALRRARFRASFFAWINLCGYGGLALVLWYGGRQVLEGELTPGALISFVFYTFMIANSVSIFASFFGQFQESLGALRRVFELLDTAPSIVDPPHAPPMPCIQGAVRLEGVSFSYNRETVLHDLHLNVAPGEVIALVGKSGAGKSTLFNLLLRFYDPTAGRITIDGIDLRDVNASSLRAQIGVVPQDTMLFSLTVQENILYGRLEASEDEVVAAARAAHAHEFIQNLPEGYDTRTGERGVNLSGGERQRVAIARAFLKNPRILLLDEATSALDSASEALVQDALARLMQGQTTFIIAHRLATVQIADRIVVLDKGRIVDVGTHHELLARGGIYTELYTQQFRSASDEQPIGLSAELPGTQTIQTESGIASPLTEELLPGI